MPAQAIPQLPDTVIRALGDLAESILTRTNLDMRHLTIQVSADLGMRLFGILPSQSLKVATPGGYIRINALFPEHV